MTKKTGQVDKNPQNMINWKMPFSVLRSPFSVLRSPFSHYILEEIFQNLASKPISSGKMPPIYHRWLF
jgi:hypothetical protein